jgi:CRISPR-associated protein Csd1
MLPTQADAPGRLDDGKTRMSLHKELSQAFGRGEPFQAGETSERGGAVLVGGPRESDSDAGRSESGFGWRRVDFALVINSAGDVIDVERPPWHPQGKRRETSMLVPQRQLRTQGGVSGFLWGSSLHALGLRRWGGRGDVRADTDSFNCFRTFHRVVLAGARDPSLRAFLGFLQTWQPDWAFDIPELAPVIGGALVFRFQYDEYFLHETHAARLLWSRLLSSSGGVQEPTEAA